MAETADSRTLVEGFTFIPVTFDPHEHWKIGEKVRTGKEKILTLPNGVRLEFAYIITLAGDFYGVPDEPIVNPLNPSHSDRLHRFINAYSTLANTPYEGKYK
ncbi:uncharacterized protein LOC114543846, partial [Dendronephthya gigantea]